MKTGFIFAGQGQQFLDMGKDLVNDYPEAKETYKLASEILGYDLHSLSLEQLSDTKYTQPALYTLNAVLNNILNNKGIMPDYVAGLSLGEYNALLSANVFSFTDGLEIIAKRANIMGSAFIKNETGMLACLKTDYKTVQNIIQDTGLEICNYNTNSQIVIGGLNSEIEEIRPIFKANKILAIPLKVSTVSHMSLLEAASNDLQTVLEQYTFKKPEIKFINNLAAEFQDKDFTETLSKHICSPTHLVQTIEKMYAYGVRRFIEVGPKGSISKFIKEIVNDDEIIIINVYDSLSLEGVNYE